jgi:arylsulfatase A-like enzyme
MLGSLLLLVACVPVRLSPGAVPPEPISVMNPGAARTAASSPSFVVLLSDDQQVSLFNRELMPRIFSEVVDKGVQFTHGYVNEPMCCPSRASILTGLYAHHTGVDWNNVALDRPEVARPTFNRALQQAGYRTMMAGKYLNSEDCHPREGWDRWICGDGEAMTQVNPILNVDGTMSQPQGRSVDILADYAVDFIQQSEATNQPFLLYYSPKTPHLPNDLPPSGFTYPFYNPPSFNKQLPDAGQPYYTQQAMRAAQERDAVRDYMAMAETVPLMDAAMGRILDALGPRADNTFVIFLSDNGFLYGEHHLGGKSQPYDEDVRVPYAVRYPPLTSAATSHASDALVANIDIAPTIMQLAGLPWTADGLSMVPLLNGEAASLRDSFLIEWCVVGTDPERCGGTVPPHYWGFVSHQYQYVEYATGENELYDLQADPYEMFNLVGLGRNPDLQRQFSAQLSEMRKTVGPPDTTIAVGPTGAVADGNVSFQFYTPGLDSRLDCRLDRNGQSGAWQGCNTGRKTYRDLAPGAYTFLARAMDAQGLVDPTPAAWRFQVGG